VTLAILFAFLPACGGHQPESDPALITRLEVAQDRLRARLEAAASKEPLVASVLAEKAPVTVGIRAGLIEELAGHVARRYLDRVTIDAGGMQAHGDGDVHKGTIFGRVKVGGWRVNIDVGGMVGDLRAGSPVVSLRQPDLVDVVLPVDVAESEGDATLDFWWDSSGLANMVCKDFRLTRKVRGRVLAQRHSLNGALRIVNTGESLDATPQFPERKVRLGIDLTPKSWQVVEAALRSQEEPGTCKALMNPDLGLKRLKELAAEGVKVRLPDAMFRTVSLPARVRKSVSIGGRTVSLSVQAHSLHVDRKTLWSSATVEVQSLLGSSAAPVPPTPPHSPLPPNATKEKP
jgi:hypothetical protein